ncbi:MAG: hypothetical protein FWG68_02450 [Defluviitaleaceae bacterium]|nr:hypothetical protein [Defluviitaleaceae bacterium]
MSATVALKKEMPSTLRGEIKDVVLIESNIPPLTKTATQTTEPYLTAKEIYEIDQISDITLGDYLASLPTEKKELAVHIFNKNRNIKMLQVIYEETENSHERLIKILEENGIQYV